MAEMDSKNRLNQENNGNCRNSINRNNINGTDSTGGYRGSGKNTKKNKRKKRSKSGNRRISPVLVVILLILLVIAGTILSKVIERYTPTKEVQDLKEYYNLTADDDMAVVQDNVQTEYFGKYVDGVPYLLIDTVQDELNSRFYWDTNENVLLYTTATQLITVNAGENQYYIDREVQATDYTIVKLDGESAYVALPFVKQYTAMDYEVIENPTRLVLTTTYGDVEKTVVKKDTQIRFRGGIKSPILKEVEKDTVLTLLEADETWTKVATDDGLIGYMKSNAIGDAYTETLASDFSEEAHEHRLLDKKINMVWHQVTGQAANSTISDVLSEAKGVNVVSPTWFYLNDNEGNLVDIASTSYVEYCHQNGVEVWALVENITNKDVSTTEVLTHTSKRQNLVNQLISYAIQYNLDGINVDFEALEGEVGDAFAQFIRELSLKCANNNVVLSVDNYAPTESSKFYDCEEQAAFADYICIMGYDEHYNGSGEGSVASIGFVENAVKDMIEMNVPAGQIVLGMPFFTRVWEETPKTEEASELEQASDDYVSYDLSSRAIGMTEQANLIAANGAAVTWLEESGQYYAEYTNDGKTYKIWMENADSLELKLQLMQQYELAGASFWKYGLEVPEIWDTILKYMQ